MAKRSFLQATRGVVIGMVIAQAIPLLGSLVIARLYAPAEFGEFSTWLGVVMMAAVLVTGRFEMALVIEADGGPRRFALVATLVAIFSAVAALLVVVLVAYPVLHDVSGITLGLVLAFLPASLLMAVVQTWQSWAAAEGLYRKLSLIRIAQALGITSLQVVAGNLAPSAIGLAIGHLLGLLLGVAVAAWTMPIARPDFRNWVEFRGQLVAFWVKHKQFPLFALPADFINTAAGQLPLFFISGQFGSEASGLYALAVRILGGPISLLGTAVLDVFKRSAAVSFRERGNCREEYLRTFKFLAGLGILLALGVVLLAEPLFAWAFGQNWRHAGVIAAWLMPMFALRFVASPLSYVFYIAGGQRVDLIWQAGLLCMTILVFQVGMNFETTVKAYAVGYAGMYAIYLLLSYRYSKGGRA